MTIAPSSSSSNKFIDGKSGAERGKPRVLIVDDEEDITRSLKIGLERSGFQVDVYNEPLAVLLKAKPGLYDLAIFDIRMPRMTGFELYRRFRTIDADVGVCFMTAYEIHASEFKIMFPDIEPVGFFTKPISIERLVGEVDKLLGPVKVEERARKKEIAS
jgi:DNA-binding response OmpR family regulator